MRVRVIYFGMLKDAVGRQLEEVQLPADSSLSDLVEDRIAHTPVIDNFRKVLAGGAGTDSPGFHALMTISPLLWDDFQAVLNHEQVTLPDVYICADRYPLLMAIAEALTDYDEVFQLFRAQHLKLAQRMIGPGSIGTGGTPMELLERTLKDKFYPELWEVRNQLTQIANEQGEL